MWKIEIIKTYKGFEVRKRVGSRWMYLSGYRNGCYYWVEDYLYAKHYSRQTAEKHVAELKKRGEL